MIKTAFVMMIAASALVLVSCGDSPSAPRKTDAAAAAPAAPAIPEKVQAAAESALGSEAEVLVFGDLAKNGSQQVLAVNRLKVTPPGIVPGTLITRVAIIENDAGTWKEIFRCDEHLKNTSGFLGGIPLAPVPSWRLQYEQPPQKGLQMYFTPLQRPAGGYIQPIAVRWNPEVKRYESLDRNFEHFLSEAPTLEMPESVLHR